MDPIDSLRLENCGGEDMNCGANYGDIKAINFSSLKKLAVSPLYYRWCLDHPEPEKPAYVIGGAIHCSLFEPGKFADRYAVFEGTRRGKAWDEWQSEHPGVRSLKPDEMSHVSGVVAAISAHRNAAAIIKACRVEEVTAWTDPVTGLACKGRIDGISPTYVVDIKSARDIAARIFLRASAGYLYHAQLAWYHDGATAARKIAGDDLPWLIAVEKTAPYDVGLYRMTEATLAAGRAMCRSLMTLLTQCTEANFWPGKVPDVEQLDLPAYMDSGIQTEEEEF
jgi:hypothetical protein